MLRDDTVKMLVNNIHRSNTKNIGDLLCAPALYFPKLFDIRSEILGFKGDELNTPQRKKWKSDFYRTDVFIVGGGGLLEIDFFRRGLDFLFNEKKASSKTILWGAGHNNWQIGDWRKMKCSINLEHYPFDLVGVRDFGLNFEWAPCVSCMHNAFDNDIPEPFHDVVIFAHTGTINRPEFSEKLPKNLPILANNARFDEVLKFLISGELILTDSYHGAYWATLLGRRVIAFPSSSKFYSLKHPVPLCDPTDWRRFENLARSYPEALYECREATMAFAGKVAEIVCRNLS